MPLYLDPTEVPEAWDTVVIKGMSTPGRCRVTGWSRPVDYDHKKGKGTKGAGQTLKELPPAKGKLTFWTWTPEQRAAFDPIIQALKFDPTKLGTGNGTTPSALTTDQQQAANDAAAQAEAAVIPTQAAPAIPQPAGVSAFTGTTPDASTSNSGPVALSSAYAIDIFYPSLAEIDVNFILPPEKLGAWEPVDDDFSHMKREIECVEYTGTPPNTSVAATPTGASPDATPSPGQQFSGGGDPAADTAGASSTAGAAADAQGAWGAP